ncbi:alpha/beta hydrolase [Bacteroides sp. 1001136B_160425_E2]|uniref:alpha/beta hydrolase n=1 Tax=Bacteroides sp. 1001136B_160425_E2 TaxID=2787083 RepID=UPI00189EB05C|nr:alpha/beta hydrolase [Bacteroides sp. 1001136B_160425_E2]
MKRIIWTIYLLLCVGILGAQEYKTDEAVSYRPGEKDSYMQERCRLDVYYPANKKDFSTVIWFHGGGLTGGNRELPEELKNKGLCIVSASYRLCPDKKDPNAINANITTDDCVDDAAAAAAWVMKNIARYGGNPNRIYLAGHSAGGYLVGMIGFDKSRLAKYDIDVDKFAALIPYSGQAITHYHNRSSRGISPYQPMIDEHAPLYYIRKDCPPILLITGDREQEMFGRYEENAYLWRMLKQVGHPSVRLYELDGFNHGTMLRPAHFLLLDFIRNLERK